MNDKISVVYVRGPEEGLLCITNTKGQYLKIRIKEDLDDLIDALILFNKSREGK